MERIKKVLIIIVTLLVIVMIITGVREFLLWNEGKLDKSNSMTREEIIALLDKGATYPNYYYSSDSKDKDSGRVEYYIRDNVVTAYDYETSKVIMVEDYNTREVKSYWSTEEGGSREEKYTDVEPIKYKQHFYDYSIVADYDTYKLDYEYLGERNFEGREVIVIQMNQQNDNKFLSGGIRFVIDKETGLILARTDFSKILFITQHKDFRNRNVKFDV